MTDDRTTVRSPLEPQPDPSATPFELGELVEGNYEIRTLLGAGGMGWVYEARDRWLNRTVAIKVARNVPGAPQLLQEAQALAAISSPSVVTVYALGHHRGAQFLVMERVYGVSLEAHLLQRRGAGDPWSIPDALDLLARIADGLASVHSAGIAHWDIKPSNVMLAPRDRIVLLDFGIFVPEVGAAQAPLFRGTPAYTAPEMVSGTVQPGQAKLVDVYALGCLAYEVLTGAVPFQGESAVKVWNQHLSAEPPDVRTLRHDAPEALCQLINEMLAKDARDRPQYVEDVAARLRRVRSQKPAPPAGELSVLVVDDDPAMAELLEAIVYSTLPTADVRTAHSGAAALAAFRARPAQLCFLDLHLPDMSGMDLCLQLRGTRMAEGCRIVPVSGSAEAHDRRLLLQLGLTTFVEKRDDLPRRIGNVVRETARLR
jgi:serine/threonine-protein kinase